MPKEMGRGTRLGTHSGLRTHSDLQTGLRSGLRLAKLKDYLKGLPRGTHSENRMGFYSDSPMG